MTTSSQLEYEKAVADRYSQAAREREDALCCPVDYDARYLKVIPEEVIERDYGCGDPSRYVREGDVVLDLGSGGGKICFIASQIVGPEGRVIGVDMNDEMLEMANRNAPVLAERIGWSNVEFRRGRIQDLALDMDALDGWLKEHPVRGAADLAAMEDAAFDMRQQTPMIPDGSIDIVVSNCVLNLVRPEHKSGMIREIFRVLRKGGRIAISDIVSDEVVPADLQADADLWSGCVSGAFEEGELLRELEEAGFYGIEIDKWEQTPFRTVRGIEFRSVTVTARKGKEGPCYEANQAVVYKGPFQQVQDDDGYTYRRGERTAVCEKVFGILTSQPYAQSFVGIEPVVPIPEESRGMFDCSRQRIRPARESKGAGYQLTTDGAADCCAPEAEVDDGPADGGGSGCC